MREFLIYHVASGQAFFTGVAVVSLAVVLALRPGGRWRSLCRTAAASFGLLLIVASATPLPSWFNASAWAVSLLWIVTEDLTGARISRTKSWLRGCVLAVWWLGVALELPYHVTPRLPLLGDPPVYVVGDSLAAGMGGERVTWPQLLAREHHVVVHDLARAGANVATAERDQARRVTEPGALVIVEIGGNDILAGTAPEAFGRSLDALLTRLRAGGRTVVMFELPLPPFYQRYGSLQREQARRHGVGLVPKRVLLGVLTAQGATLDTIHLSRAGHARMSREVWAVIRPAFRVD